MIGTIKLHRTRRAVRLRSSAPSNGRRGVVALVFALTALLATVGTASADVFNQFPNTNPNYNYGSPMYQKYTWDGCTLTVGPIQDPLVAPGAPNYRVIGGANVTNCSWNPSSIAITVREYRSNYANGAGASQYGNGFGGYVVQNQKVEFIAGCPGADGRYWATFAYFTINGVSSGWVQSPWSDRKTTGC